MRDGDLFLAGSIIILTVFFYFQCNTKEAFQDQSQVVCLMCICPNETVMKFATKIATMYKTYIVCDDPKCETPVNTPITFIKISDEECNETGWTKSNVAINKVPSAWDKALYYFAVKETSPRYVWFIEEDVFIPRPEIISEIDAEYPDADLVCKQNVSHADDQEFLWWHDADPMLQEPLYRSLVCACRLSRALLDKIVQFVDKNNRLVFIEILFNTIVFQDKMKLAMPQQLQKIIWRHDWTPDTVDDKHMFHPIKNTELQHSYRERLTQIAARKN